MNKETPAPVLEHLEGLAKTVAETLKTENKVNGRKSLHEKFSEKLSEWMKLLGEGGDIVPGVDAFAESIAKSKAKGASAIRKLTAEIRESAAFSLPKVTVVAEYKDREAETIAENDGWGREDFKNFCENELSKISSFCENVETGDLKSHGLEAGDEDGFKLVAAYENATFTAHVPEDHVPAYRRIVRDAGIPVRNLYERWGDGKGITKNAVIKELEDLKSKFAAGPADETANWDDRYDKIEEALKQAIEVAESGDADNKKVKDSIHAAGSLLLKSMEEVCGSREKAGDTYPDLDDRLETIGLLEMDIDDSEELFAKKEKTEESVKTRFETELEAAIESVGALKAEYDPSIAVVAKAKNGLEEIRKNGDEFAENLKRLKLLVKEVAETEIKVTPVQAKSFPGMLNEGLGVRDRAKDLLKTLQRKLESTGDAPEPTTGNVKAHIEKYRDWVENATPMDIYDMSDNESELKNRVLGHVNMVLTELEENGDAKAAVERFKELTLTDLSDQQNQGYITDDIRVMFDEIWDRADETLTDLNRMTGTAESVVVLRREGQEPEVAPFGAREFRNAVSEAAYSPGIKASITVERGTAKMLELDSDMAALAEKSEHNLRVFRNLASKLEAPAKLRITEDNALEVISGESTCYESLEMFTAKPARTTRKVPLKQIYEGKSSDSSTIYLVRSGNTVHALEHVLNAKPDLRQDAVLRNAIKLGGDIRLHAVESAEKAVPVFTVHRSVCETAMKSNANLNFLMRALKDVIAEHAEGRFRSGRFNLNESGDVGLTRFGAGDFSSVEQLSFPQVNENSDEFPLYVDGSIMMEGDIVRLAEVPTRIWGTITDVIDRGENRPVLERWDIYVQPVPEIGSEPLLHRLDEIAPYLTEAVMEGVETAGTVFRLLVDGRTRERMDEGDENALYFHLDEDGEPRTVDSVTMELGEDSAVAAIAQALARNYETYKDGELREQEGGQTPPMTISIGENFNRDLYAFEWDEHFTGKTAMENVEEKVRGLLVSSIKAALRDNQEPVVEETPEPEPELPHFGDDKEKPVIEVGQKVVYAGYPEIVFGEVTEIKDRGRNSFNEERLGRWEIWVTPDSEHEQLVEADESFASYGKGEAIWMMPKHLELAESEDMQPTMLEAEAVLRLIGQAKDGIERYTFDDTQLRNTAGVALRNAAMSKLGGMEDAVRDQGRLGGTGEIDKATAVQLAKQVRDEISAMPMTAGDQENSEFPDVVPETAKIMATAYERLNGLVNEIEALPAAKQQPEENFDPNALAHEALQNIGAVTESIDDGVEPGYDPGACCMAIKQSMACITGMEFKYSPAMAMKENVLARLNDMAATLESDPDGEDSDWKSAKDLARKVGTIRNNLNCDIEFKDDEMNSFPGMVPEFGTALGDVFTVLNKLRETLVCGSGFEDKQTDTAGASGGVASNPLSPDVMNAIEDGLKAVIGESRELVVVEDEKNRRPKIELRGKIAEEKTAYINGELTEIEVRLTDVNSDFWEVVSGERIAGVYERLRHGDKFNGEQNAITYIFDNLDKLEGGKFAAAKKTARDKELAAAKEV